MLGRLSRLRGRPGLTFQGLVQLRGGGLSLAFWGCHSTMYLSWASRSSWICRGCPVICSWVSCGPEDKPPKKFQWPLTLRSAFGDFWCTFPCESADFQSFQVLQKLFGLWFCENRDFSQRVSWLFHGDRSNLNLFISSLKLSVCPLNNGFCWWIFGFFSAYFQVGLHSCFFFREGIL